MAIFMQCVSLWVTVSTQNKQKWISKSISLNSHPLWVSSKFSTKLSSSLAYVWEHPTWRTLHFMKHIIKLMNNFNVGKILLNGAENCFLFISDSCSQFCLKISSSFFQIPGLSCLDLYLPILPPLIQVRHSICWFVFF